MADLVGSSSCEFEFKWGATSWREKLKVESRKVKGKPLRGS